MEKNMILNQVLEEFYNLPTGNICDASNKLGYPTKVMDSGIRPIDENFKIAAPVFTLRCPGGNNLIIHEAIVRAPRGSVLVIDTQSYMRSGHIGGIISIACQERGIKGIVIDGTCRDWEEILKLKFPVFTRGANPNSNRKEKAGELNVPVLCGGVEVLPGDILIGDISGIVVISEKNAEAVLKKAKEIFNYELDVVNKLRQGKTTMEIYGFEPINP